MFNSIVIIKGCAVKNRGQHLLFRRKSRKNQIAKAVSSFSRASYVKLKCD